MNKKGSITDAIYVPMYLLVIAVTIFISVYIWFTFQTNFSAMVSTTPHNATITNVMNDINQGIVSFDYVFPILVVGLLIVSLIFAYKTGASVVYAVLSFIFWGFALLVSAILTNIFGQFETSFPSVAASLPVITYLMNNMKWLVLGWLFLISIVMFTRNKTEEYRLAASEVAFAGGMYGG